MLLRPPGVSVSAASTLANLQVLVAFVLFPGIRCPSVEAVSLFHKRGMPEQRPHEYHRLGSSVNRDISLRSYRTQTSRACSSGVG